MLHRLNVLTWITTSLFTLLLSLGLATNLSAQELGVEIEREDDWELRKSDQELLRTRELTLHPKLEPIPALKYRLLPDDFDRVDGNAALFYLKAIGFPEKDRARELVNEFKRTQAKQAEAAGHTNYQPYNWQQTPPSDLPIEQVKKYLQLLRFQEPLLREAARRKNYSLDRNIRAEDSPIVYLLPEINAMRELARNHSLRFRLALAEGRIDDAIQYLQESYAMAEHLGRDEFIVSSLVGIAISAIAWDDTLYLLEHPDAPNMYWAFASLPSPMIGVRHQMSFERQLLFEEFKLLREVDATPRPVGYWQNFVNRLATEESESIRVVLGEMDAVPALHGQDFQSLDQDSKRMLISAMIVAAYPGAKQYLLEVLQLEPETVNAYPQAQAVLLAIKSYAERQGDEYFKWQFIPYAQAESSSLRTQVFEQSAANAKRFGWITKPIDALLPATVAIRTAVYRNQQYIALGQTVEAIRFHIAKHEGRLPKSLDDLQLPVIKDPINDQPFTYRVVSDGEAILEASRASSTRVRFILKVAP